MRNAISYISVLHILYCAMFSVGMAQANEVFPACFTGEQETAQDYRDQSNACRLAIDSQSLTPDQLRWATGVVALTDALILGDFGSAIISISQLLQRDGDDSELLAIRTDILRVLSQSALSERRKLDVMNAVLDSVPGEFEFLMFRARLNLGLGLFDAALNDLSATESTLVSQEAVRQLYLSETYLRLIQPIAAQTALRRALEHLDLQYSSDATNMRRIQETVSNEPLLMVAPFDTELVVDDELSFGDNLLTYKMIVDFSNGDNLASLASNEVLITSYPNSIPLRSYSAALLVRLGRMIEASDQVDQAFALASSLSPTMQSTSLINARLTRAVIEAYNGQTEDALADFDIFFQNVSDQTRFGFRQYLINYKVWDQTFSESADLKMTSALKACFTIQPCLLGLI